jgi:cytochrome c oxidase subunit 2
MAIAIALILIVVGSVIFHFWSPWGLAPLASNWGAIDDIIVITLIITGVVFIAINLFMALAILKFRHKAGRKAKYEPENRKLEMWLTLVTSLGIVAMLAPGLLVYTDFVTVPDDAIEMEVVGQQWSWSFRFPGPDHTLGKSDVKNISINNPFGLDPLDSNAQDDILIQSNRVYLPLDQPVKIYMRSKDVLHDFYVPQFRVKMDMVPGNVSHIWLTPTVLGEFEILCAEFCGVGHFNMRGHVQVVEQAEYEKWLAQQTVFSTSMQKSSVSLLSASAQSGQQLSQEKGCLACHDFTGNSIGPSWQGLFGRTQVMSDGSNVKVDDEYLRESIISPGAKVVKAYAPIMPTILMTTLEIDSLIAYIKERGNSSMETGQSNVLSGKKLVQDKGCVACHSTDGSKMLGPSWKGLFGKTQTLASGQTLQVDEAYLRESIFQPTAKIVTGFPPIMPPGMLSEQEAKAIIDFIRTL